MISEAYWLLLQRKQGLPEDIDGTAPRLPQGNQALVADWNVGMSIREAHGNGVNALYSDGHAKFFQFASYPAEIQELLKSGGRAASNDVWYYFNTHR